MRFANYLAPCNGPFYGFVAERCGASELVTGEDWPLAGGSGGGDRGAGFHQR